MLVSFVILHYKQISVTDACVRSIRNMDGQAQIRIVIADNDVSLPDEKRKELLEMYAADPRIQVLPIMEDRGFSYANNQGYRYAREVQKADCIIVCNNDIEFPQQDFLCRLQESLANHPCHVLGPDVVRQGTYEHQNPMDTRIRTEEEARYTIKMNRLALRFYPVVYPLVYRKLKQERQAALLRQKERTEFYGSCQEGIVPFGACLIFAPSFVKAEAEAFAPETAFFYEEYLLALRCRRKGYRIVYDPSLAVKHESGAATAKTYQTEKTRIRFMLERTAEACAVYLEALTRDRSRGN